MQILTYGISHTAINILEVRIALGVQGTNDLSKLNDEITESVQKTLYQTTDPKIIVALFEEALKIAKDSHSIQSGGLHNGEFET